MSSQQEYPGCVLDGTVLQAYIKLMRDNHETDAHKLLQDADDDLCGALGSLDLSGHQSAPEPLASKKPLPRLVTLQAGSSFIQVLVSDLLLSTSIAGRQEGAIAKDGVITLPDDASMIVL